MRARKYSFIYGYPQHVAILFFLEQNALTAVKPKSSVTFDATAVSGFPEAVVGVECQSGHWTTVREKANHL